MVNLLTQGAKYVLVILMALHAMKCFTVFRKKYDYDRGSVYTTQNVLMFMIHFICYFIIYMNTRDAGIIVFYLAQVVLFAATLIVYGIFYRRASRLLINNMCFLMMIGFMMLTRLDNPDAPAMKQFFIAVAAIIISLFIPVIVEKAAFLKKLGIAYGILGMMMIMSVLIPGIGQQKYGATGWIQIGPIGLQPSELAKIVFVFFIAAMFYKKPDFKKIVIVTICAAAYVLVLVGTKDLGAALIFFCVYLVMLYVASGQARYIFLGFGGFAAAAVAAYKLFTHVQTRVYAWMHPWGDMQNRTYQISQALFAIGTGGWFGLGLYNGIPDKIPVGASDFIFAAIIEEMGALFGVCLLLIYISCFIMFINISLQITDTFYKLLSIGLSVSYGVQIILCVGGVVKFIPHTGVTLPLISYGGSSILATILVFAVIQGLYLLKQREVYGIEKKTRRNA